MWTVFQPTPNATDSKRDCFKLWVISALWRISYQDAVCYTCAIYRLPGSTDQADSINDQIRWIKKRVAGKLVREEFRQNKKTSSLMWTGLSNRQWPIFPGSRPPSIFGTVELNFCVRDGNRWILNVIITGSFTFFTRLAAVPFKLKNKYRSQVSLDILDHLLIKLSTY